MTTELQITAGYCHPLPVSNKRKHCIFLVWITREKYKVMFLRKLFTADTTPRKFGKGALFLPFGLPSTLICNKNASFAF